MRAHGVIRGRSSQPFAGDDPGEMNNGQLRHSEQAIEYYEHQDGEFNYKHAEQSSKRDTQREWAIMTVNPRGFD